MITLTLDTNILVYSVDSLAGYRQAVATQIMLQAPAAGCVLMLQAISEFYAVAARKGKMPPSAAASQAEDWLSLFPSFGVSQTAVRSAMRCATDGRASYWDALLVATASEAGCTAILSEDMANGATLFGVRIINPFAGAALSKPAAELLGL